MLQISNRLRFLQSKKLLELLGADFWWIFYQSDGSSRPATPEETTTSSIVAQCQNGVPNGIALESSMYETGNGCFAPSPLEDVIDPNPIGGTVSWCRLMTNSQKVVDAHGAGHIDFDVGNSHGDHKDMALNDNTVIAGKPFHIFPFYFIIR